MKSAKITDIFIGGCLKNNNQRWIHNIFQLPYFTIYLSIPFLFIEIFKKKKICFMLVSVVERSSKYYLYDRWEGINTKFSCAFRVIWKYLIGKKYGNKIIIFVTSLQIYSRYQRYTFRKNIMIRSISTDTKYKFPFCQ